MQLILNLLLIAIWYHCYMVAQRIENQAKEPSLRQTI